MIGHLLTNQAPKLSAQTDGRSITSDLKDHVRRIADAKEAGYLFKAITGDEGQAAEAPYTPIADIVGGFKALTETAVQVSKQGQEDAKQNAGSMTQLVGLILQQSMEAQKDARETTQFYMQQVIDQAKSGSGPGIGEKVLEHLLTTHPALGGSKALTPVQQDPVTLIRSALDTVRALQEVLPKAEPAATSVDGLTPTVIEMMKFNSELELRRFEIGRKMEIEEQRGKVLGEVRDVIKRVGVPFLQTVGEYLQSRASGAAAIPAIAAAVVEPATVYELTCPTCRRVNELQQPPTGSMTCQHCGAQIRTGNSATITTPPTYDERSLVI